MATLSNEAFTQNLIGQKIPMTTLSHEAFSQNLIGLKVTYGYF